MKITTKIKLGIAAVGLTALLVGYSDGKSIPDTTEVKVNNPIAYIPPEYKSIKPMENFYTANNFYFENN